MRACSVRAGRPRGRRPAPRCGLIYHGGLAERFGVELLIRAVGAAPTASRRHPARVRRRHGPRGAARARRRGRARPVEISDGPVPFTEIPGELERADVGVVPTLPDPFTELLLPVKLLEYVHMGLPAVRPGRPSSSATSPTARSFLRARLARIARRRDRRRLDDRARGGGAARAAAERLDAIGVVAPAGDTTSRSSTGSWMSRAHRAARESGAGHPFVGTGPSLIPAPGRTAPWNSPRSSTPSLGQDPRRRGRRRRAARRDLDLVLDHDHGLVSKSHAYGAAQTQILIDCPRSSLIDLTRRLAARLPRRGLRGLHALERDQRLRSPADGHAARPGDRATVRSRRPAALRTSRGRRRRAPTRCAAEQHSTGSSSTPSRTSRSCTIYAQAPDRTQAIKLADATVTACRTTSAAGERHQGPARRQDPSASSAPPGRRRARGREPACWCSAVIAMLIFGCVLVIAITGLRRSFVKIGAELRAATRSRTASRSTPTARRPAAPDDEPELFLPPDPSSSSATRRR